MTGYLHPGYAASLSEFGTPRELPASGGWILERPIEGAPYRDAMGPYPLFTCRNWSRLPADLEELRGELVSIALVTDPFGNYDEKLLRRCFDRVVAFKEHLVTDLSLPPEESVSEHHRYYALKALREVGVEVCESPERYLDDWVRLYDNLIERHRIQGVRAFSREAFARQFAVPGFTMFRAIYQGETIGARLFYVQGDVAYAHLSAMSNAGYRLRAAYGINWFSIRHFSGRERWIDQGAAPGLDSGGSGGVLSFKQGWATETRTAWFCGRVLNGDRYREILQARGMPETDYFPAYRQGEYGP